MDNFAVELEKKVQAISVAAYQRTPPEEGWGAPERALYYALKDLYKSGLDADQGKAEKMRLVAQYNRDLQDDRVFRKMVKWHVDFWQRIEVAGQKFAKERTVAAAEKFFEEVYRVPLKEEQK